MWIFFRFFQFPGNMERNMDAPAAQFEDGPDIGLEGIPDHHEGFRGDVQFVEKTAVGLLGLVRHNHDPLEKWSQSGPFDLVLLVQQFSLGQQDQAVMRPEPGEGPGHPGKRAGRIVQDAAPRREDLRRLTGRQPAARHGNGRFDQAERKRLGAEAEIFHVRLLDFEKAGGQIFEAPVVRQDFCPAAFGLAEQRLILPEGIVRIECNDLNRIHLAGIIPQQDGKRGAIYEIFSEFAIFAANHERSMMTILAAALLPALILMWYVYRKDLDPEPVNLVVKGFVFGAVATFVSTLISGPLLNLGLYTNTPHGLLECIKVSFLGAAIPEECAKLFMLWLLLRNCKEFDERYDGIVYAVAVGLGFASLENLMYVLSSGADWFQVSVSRAMLAVPGHFAFAVAMGYYYSLNHFYGDAAPAGTRANIIAVPVLLHGIYDTLAFWSGVNESISGLITIGLLYFCFRLFKRTRARVQSEATTNNDRYKILRDSAPTDSRPDEQ